MAVIMYRHLKEFIHWKDKFRVEIVNIVLVLILIFGCIDCVKCLENKLSSSKSRAESGRTIPDHGIFRHDKPRDSTSSFPVKSDTDSSVNDATLRTRCQSAHGCQQSNIHVPSDGDKRNRYTYDRFKRSVTTLNFHPKPKNESKNVRVKPLRIFKYITEDDMLLKPSSETHHVTIFQPIVNAANNKAKSSKSIKGEPSSHEIDNNTSRQQVVAGTKVNLKAKLDKENGLSGNVIKRNETKKNEKIKSNDSDSKSKLQHSNKASFSAAPKPENILIFKPSLIIRKTNNKTSLIPSGNHATKYSNQGGSSNSIKPSITAATNVATHSEESTDPNSSTVNDRSLRHNNLYFDSVVTLSEEGQKQLLHQQHQTVEAHREKARKSSGNNENKHDDSNNADEIKKSITPTPSSSFSLKSNLNSNSGINVDSKNNKHNNNHNEKKISPSLPVTSIKSDVNGKGSVVATNTKQHNLSSSKATDLVKTLIHEIDATITDNNKDKVIVKVGKSKKSKNSKKSKKLQPKLDEDDDEQDGSERSRRSIFKVPIKFQQPINNNRPRFSPLTQMLNNNDQQQQLARAALFRRNPVVTRVRNGPFITKKFVPRVLTPVSHLPMPGKFTLARTILPMKPMPMMSFVKQTPNSVVSTGTSGPGPVGPPIAAIKVTNLNTLNKVNNQKTNQNVSPNPSLNGKEVVADSSKTIYSYKPLSQDVLLNQAASSYYSPTYKRFKNRFHNQISSMMDSQRELEDTISHTWDESRFPNRPEPPSKHRSRNASMRQHRDRPRHHHENERKRPDRNDRHRERERVRPHHSSHRSGQHGHHHRHGPPRGKKLGPKYTYPKNAENIQDILKFFDKEAPPGMGPRTSFEKQGTSNPNRQQSVMPGGGDGSPSAHPKLADLSGEFRDVHASLLKDIREFAKRPNLFNSGGSHSSKSHAHPLDSHQSGGSPFDPIDDIFGPKAKPVRDLIKPDLYSLENIRERIALKRGKLHGKFTDKNTDKHEYHEEEHHHDSSHRPQVEIDEIDGFYDSHRPSRHNSDGGQSVEVAKNSLFSKEDYDTPASYNKREKYNKGDDSHTIFPSSHFNDENDKDDIKENPNPFELQSAEFTKVPKRPAPTKSVILKRPNEPFRVREAEPKKKPEHDYFWNTFSNGFEKSPTMNYDTPLVLKSPTPSVLQPYNPYSSLGHGATPDTHSYPKAVSVEEEDIVEIHTGGPGSPSSGISSFSPSPDQNQFKQEKLKKMYMDVLQQKMQLEAALMQPPPGQGGSYSHHTIHHHHPSMHIMHGSASILPQHNPQQVARMAPAPQVSNFHGTPSTSFHRTQGANFPGSSSINFPGTPGGNFQGTLGGNFPGNFQGTPSGNFQGTPGANFPGMHGANFPGSPGYLSDTFPGAPSATFPQFQGMAGVTRRKKPMRMKIHIYPNGNGNEAFEQGIEAANLLAAGGFGTSGFSASNPTSVVAPPPKNSALGKQSDSAIPSGPTGPLPTSPSGYGGTSLSGPMSSAPAKNNKNVVLHLHVHRRNDMVGPLELETEGSAPVPATAKPLTYKEIFDEQMKKSEQQRNSHLSNHRDAEEEETSQSVQDQDQDTQEEAERNENEDSERGERDKSASMEVPIHDENIEDVFHSIMKFRKKPDDRKKRS